MRSTINKSPARPARLQTLDTIIEEDSQDETFNQQIKENLRKYSPFYLQSMRYSEGPASTLLYVSVSDFDSTEALKKIEAFDVDGEFRNKKIIVANLTNSENAGRAGHWDVVIKNSGSYEVEHKKVARDGKCGFVSSVLILSEICSEDDKKRELSPVLLREIERPNIEGSGSQVRQVGTAPQFEVSSALIEGLRGNDSETHKAKIADISAFHKDRIVNLLTSPSQLFLSQDEVHNIITQNDIYKEAVLAGNILDLTDLRAIDNQYSESLLPATFTRAGNQDEGLDLSRNRTLKSEFRNIVLEIMYEQKDKLDWNTDLRALVEEKLGKEFTQKIRTELGDEISLATIFPNDELGHQKESIARGFYTYKMNPNSITTAQKISEIFDVYLDKPPSPHDIKKVVACSSVCGQITNLRGLSEDEKNRFIGKGDAFSQKAQNIYPSESIPQQLPQQLPQQQLPPTLAQPLQKSSDEERSPGLKAIADFLEPVNQFLIEHILKDSDSGVPGTSPNPRRRKDIFDTIGAICCSCVGQARK